jgi:transcription-repair coupling factor (superfamily II helicase)
VADGLKRQETLHQDVETWLQVLRDSEAAGLASAKTTPPANVSGPRPSRALFFPAWEIFPHEARLPHVDVISERLEALLALQEHRRTGSAPAPLLVSSVVGLMQRTYPPALLHEKSRSIRRGDRIEPLDLIEWLEEQAYEPEAQVSQKGEIALRGGIVDVFPLMSPWPVRLEFFGDELESLRYFDPLTQISREEISEIVIPPAGELGVLKQLVQNTAGGRERQSEDLAQPSEAPSVVRSRRSFQLAAVPEYLPSNSLFLLCEPRALEEMAESYANQVPKGDSFFVSWSDLLAQIAADSATRLDLMEASESVSLSPPSGEGSIGSYGGWSGASNRESISEDPLREEEGQGEHESKLLPAVAPLSMAPSSYTSDEDAIPDVLGFSSLDAYRPVSNRLPEPQIAEAQRQEFFAQLHRWLRQNYQVHVFCNNEGERQRFIELWREYGLSKDAAGTLSGNPSAAENLKSPGAETSLVPSLHVGALSRGFMHEAAKVVVVTDAEIFGRYKVQRPRRLKSPHAQTSRSLLDIDFTELEEGDFVVHVQHGIGRYAGLQVLPVGSGRKGLGAEVQAEAGQECLVIEYASNDPEQPPPKLYVPVTEAHLVSKYVGAGKASPPLNTLGGTRWIKTKAQAERAVRDLAGELLAIQAARESQAGMAFSPDKPWQLEFESAFIYEETPDQLRSIRETKADMERARPMDRLICGDVGYGKTEVAIRAAFKAVMDGKQVALLVPTTVLAQQHFNTFRERMVDYPVRIELLSRFRSKAEQKRVVRDLQAGSVDIVIGTHRLLQNDIHFKDLGLVVIDEEQRFGVLHKEKFKLLRRLVDVLTLSATPIPRTLYLALTGARDMSTIETPPQDRLPVQTIVAQYDERVVRDAIQRELNRQGQIFFLHNRVQTIETMRQRLQTLVPHARMVVGHGQMDSDELEEVMTKFINGEADLLLSTTIIESGLDIPNANTIIIDRADRFGLSDLYQLRGRVGRYKHQAYAYLLLPRHASLLSDVRKRISAIKQYSSLGSGFKIAMRDLEIRGAGNLLGPEQSGHITAVGFELYCQLLKQSIGSLKGEKPKPRVEVQVRFDFLALNPAEERTPTKGEPQKPTLGEGRISVPREAAIRRADGPPEPLTSAQEPMVRAPAYVPFKYISDSRQRIDVYRKLAQASEKSALAALQSELRDRFGPIPPPVELLLQVADLKILASERSVSVIETKEDKLMLTRNGDYITVGGKFPRLTKRAAKARLNEIKKLLLAL